MALVDNAWYVNFGDGATTGYYGLTVWSNHTAVAGEIIRQLTTPAVGSERVFVCTTAGATGAVEPTWVNTRGALNTSSVAVYQECTGIAALNGDATNTPSWTITATPPGGVKGTAVTLGEVIKRDSGASYQICTIAGTAGSGAEPAFSNTAGVTTADNTVTWTSLGVVGNFTGWQAPHARVANAFASTWGQAGNTFFVGDNHAETQSTAITWTSPGTYASPCFVYDVDRSVAVPPGSANLKTTASASMVAAGNFGGGGVAFFNGLIINYGTAAATANLRPNATGYFWKFENCALVSAGTGVNSGPLMAGTNGVLWFKNTTNQWAASSGTFFTLETGQFFWENTANAIQGASIPASIFGTGNALFATAVCIGVDFNALGSGKSIVAAGAIANQSYKFIDCKLGASVTVAGAPTTLSVVDLIRCDSGATNYRTERYAYGGTLTTDTTIVRTGGATDGTTLESWKIITTANSKWIAPFDAFPISIWNDSLAAITTLTIYGTTTGGGVPKDDEIWVEVEYLGSGATPQGSFITTTKINNLAASATTNNSADASTWAGGGAGNGFKILVPTFTPGMKGPINITVKAAKATTTYYIDPKPVVV